MSGTFHILIVLISAFILSCASRPVREPAAAEFLTAQDPRIEELLSQMTLEEKLQLLGGTGFGTKAFPRLGIYSIEMIDGPQGVRGPRATAFPSTLSMMATWNPELMRKTAAAIGRETRASGRNMILGPCVTLYRVPQGGRNYECSSEDPYLNSRFAEAYVWGTKDSRVLSSTKHFLLNNQDINRNWVDMRIDDRGLHELELPAFETAIAAGTETVMASYNRIDGLHASENRRLISGLLKGELGFKGPVVSDWESTYNGNLAANAGLDLEMPTGEHLNPFLIPRIRSGEIKLALINDKVRRLLGALKQAGALEGPVRGNPADMNSPENQLQALRSAEESMVLLKNDKGLLPLNPQKLKSIAVVGPGAATRRIHGNGSGEVSTVLKYTSLLQGLKKYLGPKVKVRYAPGVRSEEQLELVEMVRPELEGGTLKGFKAEYFNNVNFEGPPLITRQEPDIQVWNTTTPDPRLKFDHYSSRWTGTFVNKRAGTVKFEFLLGYGYRFTVDGKVLRELSDKNGEWISSVEVPDMSAGNHEIKIEFLHTSEVFKFALTWQPPKPDMAAALEAAKNSDVVIAVVGSSNVFENEGSDRKDIMMPGDQDLFIQEILKVNPRTIVVVNSGGIVSMRAWRDQAPAILQAWFAGQEGNHAAARVLLGLVNPSGKLPVTIPRALEDSPSSAYYQGQNDLIDYSKVGIFEGYRGYEKAGIQPEFPFGHGLSYSRFAYSKAVVQVLKDRADSPKVRVRLNIQNTSKIPGAEVVQLYVSQNAPKLPRPPKELKAFQKVYLKAGETKEVSFELNASAFRYWDPSLKSWVIDADQFKIRLGSSSVDLRSEVVFNIKR